MRSLPPTRRPGRMCARCPTGHLACVVVSAGCVRARWSCSQRQGPASAGVGQGPVGASEQSQSARRSSQRNGLVQRTGGGVQVSSAIAPRDVSARARPPRLIEPSGQRLRGALPAAAGTRAPLVVVRWLREVARVTPFQATMAWRSACCVSCSGAAGARAQGLGPVSPGQLALGGWRARPSAGPSRAAQVPLQGCRHLVSRP